jgi:dipeptidase E
MRALLGSGGFRSKERQANFFAEMQDFFGKEVEEILFVPYALHDHDAYVKAMRDQGFGAGYRLRGIHEFPDPREAVRQAQAVYVGGGNSFRLVHSLQQHGLLEVLREQVAGGLPYLGVSAGCNVACPTMMTTNDMPIVQPASFEGLGLVPYQVNAHYFRGQTWVKEEGDFLEHFGETRDDRIREFHEMNATPVIGLPEGGVLRNEAGQVELKFTSAVLFQPGESPKNFAPGFDISAALA